MNLVWKNKAGLTVHSNGQKPAQWLAMALGGAA